MGHGFCFIGGPRGLVVGGRKGSLAQVRASPGGEGRLQPSATSSATPPSRAQVRPGQGGSRVLRLGPRGSPRASRQQLLPVPSPEAREPASGSWMGQMAGDRLGGTAESGEVGSGHLARPLATQLFAPHGGWERPQQQAEAKLGGEEDGPPPPRREPAHGEEPGSARL